MHSSAQPAAIDSTAVSSNASNAGQRDHAIDALRGFALLGILLVNAGSFASTYFGMGVPDPAFSRLGDQAVRWLVSLLFESKFYLLFSLLFGYSFALQMDSAQRAGSSFVPRFLRRLGGLALLGLAHAWLLFAGDILLTYALLGLVLLALRRLRPFSALVLALTLLLTTAAGWGLLAWLVAQAPLHELPIAEVHAKAQYAAEAYRASAWDAITQRGRDMAEGVWFVLVFVQAPCALAMFVLGLAAQRSGFLASLAHQPERLRRWMVFCLPLGVAGALFYASAQGSPGAPQPDHVALAAMAVDLVTAPLLTFGYVAGLLWALHHGAASHQLAAVLAPAGRMALSNYLLQSMVGAVVFTAYGFALVGRVAPWLVMAGALLLYGVQLVSSRWWMARHAYGPAEWLLRAFTLWQWPAWRRRAE